MQRPLVTVICFFTKKFSGSSWGVPRGTGQRSFLGVVLYLLHAGYKYKIPSRYESNSTPNDSLFISLQPSPMAPSEDLIVRHCCYGIFIPMTPIPLLGGNPLEQMDS